MKILTTTELLIEFLNGNINANDYYISVDDDREKITAYYTVDHDKALEIQQINKHGEIEVTRMKLIEYSCDTRNWKKY